MVQQTRQIVEDYVLYRVHLAVSREDLLTYGNSYFNKEDARKLVNLLPPQQSPSRLNLAVRNCASQYENKYKETFPDLLEQIRSTDVSTNDVEHIFSRISKDLFHLPLKRTFPRKADAENGNIAATATSDKNYVTLREDTVDDSHVKWGHVIALLVFAGIIAVRAVECRKTDVVDAVVQWVTNFFETELRQWLEKQGGWESLAEWSRGSIGKVDNTDFDPNNFATGIRTVMSAGVLAACVGIAALMMTKK